MAVLKNAIALLRLSMGALVIDGEQLALDMVVDEKQVLHRIDDEQLVLHNFIVVEEVSRIVVVEEMLETVDCTVHCHKKTKEDTFSENKNEDAHDHIDRVLSIVGLFNTLGVSKDAVMLQFFLFTLTEAAKRWVDRLAPRTINTWDLLKKAFIQRYCPPSQTAKQLEDIHNFKKEGDESLYQAWEWYNDMLYKCPTHDINSPQKVNIFYKGLM
ncbi:hypothetical protein Tco_0250717 [Tanacetum coccineum]